MANLLRNYIPGMREGCKILPEEILGAGVTVYGDVWYVDYDNGSDSNTGDTPGTAFKTVDKAVTSATTNQNDVIMLSANATHALTAMETISKNRLNFVSSDFAGRRYGQGTKISLGATTATTDIGTWKVTGIRNSFTGIKFQNSNTVDEGIYCIVDAGEYSVYRNCEIYKSTDLDVTGAAEVLLEGDSSQYFDCTIGSLANAISGDISRPCVLIDKDIVSGKVARDVEFNGCNFWRRAGHANNLFVKLVANGDAERMVKFKECEFFNSPQGTTMTVGMYSADNGTAVLPVIDCNFYGCTDVTGDSNNGGIYIIGNSPTGTTAGKLVQASAA